jgi:hypothetical protein
MLPLSYLQEKLEWYWVLVKLPLELLETLIKAWRDLEKLVDRVGKVADLVYVV